MSRKYKPIFAIPHPTHDFNAKQLRAITDKTIQKVQLCKRDEQKEYLGEAKEFERKFASVFPPE